MGSLIESTPFEIKCRLNSDPPFPYSFYIDLPNGWDATLTLTNSEEKSETFELFETYLGEDSLLAQVYCYLETQNKKRRELDERK